MSAREFAIADTCFLIDWAAWRRRDLLLRLFRAVFVPELVLREVRSERTLEWIVEGLSRGSLALFTETPDVLDLAVRVVERSRLLPVRGVDLPEAVCLAAGKLRGYIVITENRGALAAADLLEELSGVTVWRALELIAEGFRRGLLTGNPREVFEEYERETGHRFPRRDLEVVLRELGGEA
jgi:predicted nucleic acid-binding protein